MALFDSKVGKQSFVALWVLRSVARHIGFDAKAGALSARNLFAAWTKQKWQRVPKPIRKAAFGVGIGARTAWRGVRHSGRTIKHGARMGAIEGTHRHREAMELQALHREFPGSREHPHYTDTLERIKEERKARWTEHQIHATEIRLAARQKKSPPKPPKTAAPVTEDPAPPTMPDPHIAPGRPKVDAKGIPHHPGEPATIGDWRVTYTAADGTTHVFDGRDREHAEAESLWWEHRKDAPGGHGGSVMVEPMPDRLEKFRKPSGALHFGATADDPHGVRGCGKCGGTSKVGDDVCPSCAARSDLRKADWNQRNPSDLTTTNGQVTNPGGCSSCAHNH